MTQHLAVHFLSQRTDWQTPVALKEELQKEFGPLKDVCPTDHKEDMLQASWPDRVFCNPPYGRQIGKWVKKALDETMNGRTELAVLLLPARTDTHWFHAYLFGAELRFIKGRLHFDDRGAAPFPSLIAILSSAGLCSWCFKRVATEFIFEPGGSALWICGACRVSFNESNVDEVLRDVCRTCGGDGRYNDFMGCPDCGGEGFLDY